MSLLSVDLTPTPNGLITTSSSSSSSHTVFETTNSLQKAKSKKRFLQWWNAAPTSARVLAVGKAARLDKSAFCHYSEGETVDEELTVPLISVGEDSSSSTPGTLRRQKRWRKLLRRVRPRRWGLLCFVSSRIHTWRTQREKDARYDVVQEETEEDYFSFCESDVSQKDCKIPFDIDELLPDDFERAHMCLEHVEASPPTNGANLLQIGFEANHCPILVPERPRDRRTRRRNTRGTRNVRNGCPTICPGMYTLKDHLREKYGIDSEQVIDVSSNRFLSGRHEAVEDSHCVLDKIIEVPSNFMPPRHDFYEL